MCLNTGINQSWWWAGNQLPLLSQKQSYLWGDKTNLHLTQETTPLHLVWSPQWWKMCLPSYWQDMKVLYCVIKPPLQERAVATSQQMLAKCTGPWTCCPVEAFPCMLSWGRHCAGHCLGARGKGEDGKRKISFAHSPAPALAKATGAKFGPHDLWKQSPTDMDQMLWLPLISGQRISIKVLLFRETNHSWGECC